MREPKSALDILDAVEQTSKTNEKLSLLREIWENEDDQEIGILKLLVDSALNYQKLFYIKDLPELETSGESYSTWAQEFKDLLTQCEKTGRTKETKEDVYVWLSTQSPQVGKWCRRTLLRDLRCGVSVETANKAGFEVPVFEVQLATDGKKSKKINEILEKKPLISPKLDGYRCIAIINNGNVELFSRNGTRFQNFPTIEKELGAIFPNYSLVLDGEIMSNSFNNMQQSAFASKRGTTVGDVVYNVFDAISPTEWNSNNFQMGYAARFASVEILIGTIDSELVKVVPHERISSMEEALYFERVYTEKGFEGAILSPDIPYYRGRASNKMLKFKTMQSEDCKIIGFIEGTGKYEGMLGALIVEQGNFERCEVGSGFVDADREHIWQNKKDFLDRIIEVKHQELTDDGIMRFPIFLRFRDDKRSQNE